MPVLTFCDYEIIPTGEYAVQIVGTEEDTGQFGQQLKWNLEVIAGEQAGKELMAWTSLSTSLKSKLAKWTLACGIDLEAGDELDTDDLKGKKCLAVVVVNTKDDGSEYSKVQELKAPRKKTAKPAPKPAPAAAEADEDDPFAEE